MAFPKSLCEGAWPLRATPDGGRPPASRGCAPPKGFDLQGHAVRPGRGLGLPRAEKSGRRAAKRGETMRNAWKSSLFIAFPRFFDRFEAFWKDFWDPVTFMPPGSRLREHIDDALKEETTWPSLFLACEAKMIVWRCIENGSMSPPNFHNKTGKTEHVII